MQVGKGIAENEISRDKKWVSEERREDGEKRMYQKMSLGRVYLTNCKDRK